MRRDGAAVVQTFLILLVMFLLVMLLISMYSRKLDAQKIQTEHEFIQIHDNDHFHDALNQCRAACTMAQEDGCSKSAIAKYCATLISGGIDLNGDLDTTDYVLPHQSAEIKLLGGTCESTVFCQTVDNCPICGENLTLERCIAMSCDSAADSTTVLEQYPFGTCMDSLTHWEASERQQTWDHKLISLIECYCKGEDTSCDCLSGTAPCLNEQETILVDIA